MQLQLPTSMLYAQCFVLVSRASHANGLTGRSKAHV
jgi:hypothetical protein